MPSKLVMGKFKAGTLKSGSDKGPKVKDKKQAVAIMLSEQRKESKMGGKYQDASKIRKARSA
jgi:hypothetical protein